MDETKRPQWPHLENIDRIKVERPEWFDRSAQWVVTEKLHGFNARFGIDPDGTPWCGPRNNVIHEGGDLFAGDPTWPREAQQGFVGYAASHIKWLAFGETLFGEWAGKGIQKGIDYGPKDFYAFGLMDDTGNLAPWDDLASACAAGNIKTVPLIYIGLGLPSMEILSAWRDATSLIATTQRGGICLTQDPPARDGYGHYLIGKFKGAAFSEVSHAKRERPEREAPDITAVQDFVFKFATPERLQHVLDQVAEECHFQFDNHHKDPLDIVNMGRVLRTMYQDVVREAGAEYEALADGDKKRLGAVLNTATKALRKTARTEELA
jgi:hypothetical protein